MRLSRTNIRWWIGATAMFGMLALLAIDFGLWAMIGEPATISHYVQDYLGGWLRSLILGMVVGGLLVHWSGWGQRKE